MFNLFKKLVITFFGTGYLPIAPGTWGSLAAAVIFLILAFSIKTIPLLYGILGGMIILATILGVVLGPWAVEFFQKIDPGHYVLDEAAGMWIALLFIPFHNKTSLLIIAVVQFLLFRIFDILKPPPASQAENLPHGWGIMADDLIAGVFANFCGQILFRLILPATSFKI
ncbi:MAG: phosphatidylglycerophosphatase A [Phycisphaerae bacterium]|jgi:phosphatidylglycerophosphatase A|nr:phosphatidylglycerophosphatase A [Phycisphaerae bacterium]